MKPNSAPDWLFGSNENTLSKCKHYICKSFNCISWYLSVNMLGWDLGCMLSKLLVLISWRGLLITNPKTPFPIGYGPIRERNCSVFTNCVMLQLKCCWVEEEPSLWKLSCSVTTGSSREASESCVAVWAVCVVQRNGVDRGNELRENWETERGQLPHMEVQPEDDPEDEKPLGHRYWNGNSRCWRYSDQENGT